MEEISGGQVGPFEDLEVIRLEAGMSTSRFVKLIDMPERTWRRWQAKARQGQGPKGPWPPRVIRVVTDNGANYRASRFVAAVQSHASRHQRTRPYTPRHNGKTERSQRLLSQECLCPRLRLRTGPPEDDGSAEGFVDLRVYAASVAVGFMMSANSTGMSFP